MKKLFTFLAICLLLVSTKSFGQGMWTWMNGDSTISNPVYGTQGVSSPTVHPEAMYEGECWTANDGNFWYYGDGDNLWKYDVSINEWTWMKGNGTVNALVNYGTQGVAAPDNTPGKRQFCSSTWTDTTGGLWLFGGYTAGANRSDLWKYDIATNMWTWISGSDQPNAIGEYGTLGFPSVTNYPSSREETNASWTDALTNSIWLFGGLAYDVYSLYSDLWKYDIATNEWTWMSGADSLGMPPSYGSLQIASPTNHPGGRCVYAKWKDVNNNFWLLGAGSIFGPYLNDMWKYEISNNEWTWMAGSNISNQSEYFVGECDYDSLNTPSSQTFEWKYCGTDLQGRLWAFDYNNRLWNFEPDSSSWLQAGTSPPHNGVLGVPNSANWPKRRNGGSSWIDTLGNFWIFTNNGANSFGNLMWKYEPDPSCGIGVVNPNAGFNADNVNICQSACINFSNLSSDANSYQWIFYGAIPDSSNLENPTNICYNNPGSYNVTLIASNGSASDTLLLLNYINVFSPVTPVIVLSNDTLVCQNNFSSYQWFENSVLITVATNSFYIPTSNGTYSVEVTDSNGCSATDSIDFYLQPQANIQVFTTKVCPDSCITFGNTSTNASTYEWYFDGAIPNYSTDQFPSNICYSTSGIYDVTLIVHNVPYSDTVVASNLIEVYPSPNPNITQSNDTLYANNSLTGSTYQWQLNNNNISGATNTFYIPAANGNYSVVVTSANGCTASDDIQVTIDNVNDIATDSDFQIFPNLADESVTIRLGRNETAQLKLYNTLGQLLQNDLVENKPIINTKNLSTGVYYISLQTVNDLRTKKLTVSHH